jgi:hypothetical protein
MSTADAGKLEIAGAVGAKAGEVLISIDYAIIQHFSEHLYGSPSKAVEELVTNGYDALASDVRVYVPGEQVVDRIVIWDDGESMDVDALKRLWWIAKSPKADGTSRVAASEKVPARKLIGKFGIGKLASYSVGRRITHLCKSDDGYLLVHIDYRALGLDATRKASDVPEEAARASSRPGDAAATGVDDRPENAEGPADEPHRSPIVRLQEDAARAWVLEQFREGLKPDMIDAMWGRESWTLAVVSDLKDVELPPGRLGWVLSTGMPLREDFRVYVNDVEVKSKLAGGQSAEWDLSRSELAEGLKSTWTVARNAHKVSGELHQDTGADDAGLARSIRFPELGEVKGHRSVLRRGAGPRQGGRAWAKLRVLRVRARSSAQPRRPVPAAPRSVVRHLLSRPMGDPPR